MISLALPALAALSFTACIWATEPGILHVPVVRSEAPSGLQQALRKRASGKLTSVDLHNLHSIYSINISIAEQTTCVVLDTGSTELWVDPDCDTASRESVDDEGNSMDSQASSPTYCESIGRYDPSSSTSAEDLQHGTEFVYADGTTIEVNYYADTIQLGGLTVSKQEFGVANATNATSLGIMGLGPDPVHGYNMTLQTYSSVLDSLASQAQIASRAFSLGLRDSDNSTGSLIFGGLDNMRFSGSLQALPLETVQATYKKTTYTEYGYYVTVQSIAISKQNTTSSSKYSQASFLAVLDSGTSVILTPPGVSAQICNDVGGTDSAELGCYIKDCSIRTQTGGLNVEFEGKTIQVTYENLIEESVHNGVSYCFLGVSDTTVDSDPPTYILGAPFLRASYAVFDWENQQVHLAQAADCGSNIVAIGSGTGAVPTGAGCQESSSTPRARWGVGVLAGMAITAVAIVQ